MGQRIGFTGPFSDRNLGDYAMLLNDIYEIKESEITLFTYNKPFVQQLADDYLSDFQVTLCDVQIEKERGCGSFYQKMLRKFGLWSEPKCTTIPIELLCRLENSSEVYRQVAALDVLVVSGGGFLNQMWSLGPRRDDLIAIMLPILIAAQFRKKILFSGNTYGPFDQSQEFFFCFFQALDHAIFACRDTVYSQASMHRLGIERDRLPYVPDDLLFLHPKLRERKGDSLPPTGDYLVLELYDCPSVLREYENVLKNFIHTMKERYGVSTVFLPFDDKEGGMEQGRFLQQCSFDVELYDITRRGYLPVEDAAKLIEQAQLVISNRYHALVLGIASGVPSIQIQKNVCGDKRYYYCKGMGVLKEVFAGIPFDEREYLKINLRDALEELIQHYPLIRDSQLKRFGETYRGNLERLRRIRQQYYSRALKETNEEGMDYYGQS